MNAPQVAAAVALGEWGQTLAVVLTDGTIIYVNHTPNGAGGASPGYEVGRLFLAMPQPR